MRRVVIDSPGGRQKLKIEDTEDPEPVEATDVVVESHAVGVNFADVIVRLGLYSSAREFVGWPITPGFEFSGRVARIGTGVQSFNVGDEVFGVTRFGGYSTHQRVPESQLFVRPQTLTKCEAAAFPAVYLTAYYALVELADAKEGATLLVHSAAGGVGTALTQLGRALGCRVVGVVGASHKVAVAKAMGAAEVVDRSKEPLWKRVEACAPNGYDVVLDANGYSTLRASYDQLKHGGRLIVYGAHEMMTRGGSGKRNWPRLALTYIRTPRFDPFDLITNNRSIMGFNVSYLFHHIDLFQRAMTRLLGLVETGAIAPPKVTEFPFSDVEAAHESIESGQTVGKLVLVV